MKVRGGEKQEHGIERLNLVNTFNYAYEINKNGTLEVF